MLRTLIIVLLACAYPPMGHAAYFAAKNDRLYVSNMSGFQLGHTFRVFDISTPTEPFLVNSIELNSLSNHVALGKDYGMLTTRAVCSPDLGEGIVIFPLDDTLDILSQYVGSYTSYDCVIRPEGYYLAGVFGEVINLKEYFLVGSQLWMTEEGPSLQRFVKFPRSGKVIKLSPSSLGVVSPSSESVDYELVLVDVSDLGDAKVLGEINILASKLGGFITIGDIISYGDFVYITDEENGLTVYDISNKRQPLMVGSIPTAHLTFNMATYKNYLLALDFQKGLLLFDLENPSQPKLIGKDSSFPRAYVSEIYIFNGVLYHPKSSTEMGAEPVDKLIYKLKRGMKNEEE